MGDENHRVIKKTSLPKKLVRFLTIKKRWKSSSSDETLLSKAQPDSNHKGATPKGSFPVYVGPEKQKFMIKAESANHPLFRLLLEDAELEYGFNSEGPLLIPCEVDLFRKILVEMDSGKGFDQVVTCGFWSPFNPKSRLGKSDMGKGVVASSYGHLTPPR